MSFKILYWNFKSLLTLDNAGFAHRCRTNKKSAVIPKKIDTALRVLMNDCLLHSNKGTDIKKKMLKYCYEQEFRISAS